MKSSNEILSQAGEIHQFCKTAMRSLALQNDDARMQVFSHCQGILCVHVGVPINLCREAKLQEAQILDILRITSNWNKFEELLITNSKAALLSSSLFVIENGFKSIQDACNVSSRIQFKDRACKLADHVLSKRVAKSAKARFLVAANIRNTLHANGTFHWPSERLRIGRRWFVFKQGHKFTGRAWLEDILWLLMEALKAFLWICQSHKVRSIAHIPAN